MKVTIESEFEAGDKISFYFRAEYVQGTIIEVAWDESFRAFKYLIETDDKSRNWHDERSLTGGRR